MKLMHGLVNWKLGTMWSRLNVTFDMVATRIA
jgi:hypothetical protein